MAAFGAALGYLAGDAIGSHRPSWAFVGARIGVALVVHATTLLRARPLLNWLRGPQTQRAPRDAGFWGEMGYRVERALRSRERDLEHGAQRLTQFLSAIEASPNGVLLLDDDDQHRVVQRRRGRPLRARPGSATGASA